MCLSRPLLLDLYQLTMAQSYFALGMRELAVFELFVRSLPRSRGFLVAAGLAQSLEYLEGLRFENRCGDAQDRFLPEERRALLHGMH